MSSPTSLADLPDFTVAGIVGTPHDLRLQGRFSRVELVRQGSCWLRMPDGFPFYATVTALDTGTGLGTLESTDELPPALAVGGRFPLIDGYWGLNEVNTILDREHQWSRVTFEALDAFERPHFQLASGAQRVAQTGRAWRKASGDPAGDEHVLKGGWDHEHCMLCFQTIRPGDVAFTDPDDYWLCRDCHSKFGSTGDLGFILGSASRPDA